MSWSKQQQQQKIWYFLSLQKLQTSTSHVSVTDITHALTHCTDSWLATHPQRMLIAGLEGELGSTGSGQLNAAVGLELVCAQTVWVWTVCARAYSHVFACQLIVHTASLACSSPVFVALDKRHFDVVPATLHAVFPPLLSSRPVSFLRRCLNQSSLLPRDAAGTTTRSYHQPGSAGSPAFSPPGADRPWVVILWHWKS